MRVLIAGSIQGDGSYEEEAICRCLCDSLRELGHTVDLFFLPYERNILSLPEQILAYQLLQIDEGDLLITVGYPACTLRHHNKVCYLLQTEPMLSDYWDSALGVLANYQYSQILFSVQKMEHQALHEARHVFCCSKRLSDEINRRYDLHSKPMLYPAIVEAADTPVQDNEDQTPYVLCESALLPWQREDLLFLLAEQMQVRLFVPNAQPIYLETVQSRIKQCGLEERLVLTERRANRGELMRAEWIFIPDYHTGRISNTAVWGMSERKPLAAMEDCGALQEILPAENLLKKDELERLVLSERKFLDTVSPSMDWSAFAKEMLQP